MSCMYLCESIYICFCPRFSPTHFLTCSLSVIPTLSHLKVPGSNGIRALLLAPTRELAEQIHREVLRLVEGRRFKICLLGKKVSGKAIANQVSLGIEA